MFSIEGQELPDAHLEPSGVYISSNQTYIASFGFVPRVYLADTNTDGLPGKFCNVV